jgi:hypothetical protein
VPQSVPTLSPQSASPSVTVSAVDPHASAMCANRAASKSIVAESPGKNPP